MCKCSVSLQTVSLGFRTGIPRVGCSHPAPVPPKTVPVGGPGRTHRRSFRRCLTKPEVWSPWVPGPLAVTYLNRLYSIEIKLQKYKFPYANRGRGGWVGEGGGVGVYSKWWWHRHRVRNTQGGERGWVPAPRLYPSSVVVRAFLRPPGGALWLPSPSFALAHVAPLPLCTPTPIARIPSLAAGSVCSRCRACRRPLATAVSHGPSLRIYIKYIVRLTTTSCLLRVIRRYLQYSQVPLVHHWPRSCDSAGNSP